MMAAVLTPDEAMAMLPRRGRIHTFVNAQPGVMIGADWDRRAVLRLLRRKSVKLLIAGPGARETGHGLAVLRENKSTVFIQTKEMLA